MLWEDYLEPSLSTFVANKVGEFAYMQFYERKV